MDYSHTCVCVCSVPQLYPTVCDPIDCRLPSSSLHGIFQAGILERVVYPAYYIAAVVQPLSHVWLFVTPWTTVHQTFLSFTISWNLLKLISIETVMPSNHLVLCCPLLLLSSIISASGHFLMNWRFASHGQSIGASASASVFPTNIQDWYPLGLTGLIFLQTKGLSRVFSNITVQKCHFFHAQPSLWSNSHIHAWLLEKQ